MDAYLMIVNTVWRWFTSSIHEVKKQTRTVLGYIYLVHVSAYQISLFYANLAEHLVSKK